MKTILHFSECAKCVPSKYGPTCCKNGSWKGKCGPTWNKYYEHSWAEGLKVCAQSTKPKPATTPEATTPQPTTLEAISPTPGQFIGNVGNASAHFIVIHAVR